MSRTPDLRGSSLTFGCSRLRAGGHNPHQRPRRVELGSGGGSLLGGGGRSVALDVDRPREPDAEAERLVADADLRGPLERLTVEQLDSIADSKP